MVDAKFLDENFTIEELNECGIYTSGISEVKTIAYACGSATVKAYDSATVKASSNSYVKDCTGNIKSVSGRAIVKDHYGKKIYIKKGEFEIIEI